MGGEDRPGESKEGQSALWLGTYARNKANVRRMDLVAGRTRAVAAQRSNWAQESRTNYYLS